MRRDSRFALPANKPSPAVGATWRLKIVFWWMSFTSSMTMLALESQDVVRLRLLALATGRAGSREVRLMVTEKTSALSEAAVTLATGGSPRSVVNRYRAIVRANRVRLQAA